MTGFLRLMERFSRVCVWICGFLLIATSMLIALEVILRKFFAVSLGGADEISSYVLAILCSWSLGFALFHKGHVRIDILYIKLSPKAQALLDCLSLVMFLIYMSTLSYFASLVLMTSIDRGSTANTPLQTPMWIPQSLWLFGLLSFTVIILAILAGTVWYLLKGDLASARGLAGTSSLEAEKEL
jgi:TRAP-type mannitol/chloroaromatic compound transport system permease small subunit